MFRNSSYDGSEGGLRGDRMLFGNIAPELVQIDIFLWLRRIHLRFIFLN